MFPLLTTAYLPPIEYIALIAREGGLVLEQHEHFVKQTYRNRAVILSANGPLPLIIPLKKGKNNQRPIGEVEIDYAEPWQKTHWRAIVSGYNRSPYFEHYADYLQPFYTKEHNNLLDYNSQLLTTLLGLLKIKAGFGYTEGFVVPPAHDNDHRFQISPKEPNCYMGKPYRQVFSEKFAFVPNLSALDLLFNKGNYAKDFL